MQNTFPFLVYFICTAAMISCTPLPEQDSLIATSLETDSAQSQEPEEREIAATLHGMFQANNTDPSLLSIDPHQLFVCKRNQDVITVALYFYEPDKNKMICSFLSYSRIYKQETSQYMESNSHIAAPFDEDCKERAEEKLNTTEALKGWNCVENNPT